MEIPLTGGWEQQNSLLLVNLGLVNGANMFAWHYCCSQWLSRAAVSIRTSEVHPSTIFHGPGKLSKALVMIPIFPGCLYSQRKEGSPKGWLPT